MATPAPTERGTASNVGGRRKSQLPQPLQSSRPSMGPRQSISRLPAATPTPKHEDTQNTTQHVRRPSTSRTRSANISRLSTKPGPSSTLENPPSSNTRFQSLRSSSSQHPGATTASRPSLSKSTARAPQVNRRASLRTPKPSFTTHQQHYTPGKPAIRSKSGAPSGHASSTSTSTDRAKVPSPLPFDQQAEFVHLHALHSLAQPTQIAWSKSAESHFHGLFSDLGYRGAELHAISSEQQGLLNSLALTEWGAGIPSTVIGEKVGTLSRDLGELEEMVVEGGKFERVRGVWEVWIREAESVRRGREHVEGRGAGAGVGGFVEGIGDGWKAEAMVLERELSYVRRTFEQFGSVREESGLGSLVRLGKILCQGLVEELDVMQGIEEAIMFEEGTWVDEMVGNLGKGVSDKMTLVHESA